jgi:hypothetical protein
MISKKLSVILFISIIMIMLLSSAAIAQDRRGGSNDVRARASAKVVAKLTSILPRYNGLIEPKLGSFNLRGNEPSGASSVGDSTRWDGNADGCEVTVMSKNRKILYIRYIFRTRYLDIAKAAEATISKIRQPNTSSGNKVLEFWDQQTKLVVWLTAQGFEVTITDTKAN